MTNVEIPIIASSSELAGAVNKNSIGSRFDIQFNQPIIIPSRAQNITVRVDEATVWHTTPNISDNLGNNKLYIEYLGTDYVITIPNGLYSITDLNVAVDRESLDVIGTSGLINFEPDNATQRASIVINQADVQVDFTPADTFRDVLGFNSQLIPSTGPSSGTFVQLGDNIAAFNNIEFYLIGCDIINDGIRINNAYYQIIYQVLIDVAPGSQIVSREFNPPVSDASNLAGNTIDRISVWLNDQNLQLVDTNGEDFSCRIVVKYSI